MKGVQRGGRAVGDGAEPERGERTDAERELVGGVDAGLVVGADQIDRVELSGEVRKAMEAAAGVNGDRRATGPWNRARTDPDRARVVLGTALDAVNGVRGAFTPYLPCSSAALDEVLGPVDAWLRPELSPGLPIGKPSPLFAKVDVEELFADDDDDTG